jgi:hypothetical protein
MHSHPSSRSGQISLGRSGQGPAGSGQGGPARDRSGRAGPDLVEKTDKLRSQQARALYLVTEGSRNLLYITMTDHRIL